MKKVYEFLNKLAIPLEKVIFSFAGAGMALIAVIIFVQVIFRLMGRSLSWSEEISRYIEVWIVFLTAGYALGKGQHICMDLLIPQKGQLLFRKSQRCDLHHFRGELYILQLSLHDVRTHADVCVHEHLQGLGLHLHGGRICSVYFLLRDESHAA